MLTVLALFLAQVVLLTAASVELDAGAGLERRSVPTPSFLFTFGLGTDFRWPLVSSYGTLNFTVGGNTISMIADVIQLSTNSHKIQASYMQIPYTTGTPFLFSSLYSLTCDLVSTGSLGHIGDYSPPLSPVPLLSKIVQVIPTGRYTINSGFAGTCNGKMQVYGDAYPVSFTVTETGITNMAIAFSSSAEQPCGDPPASISATFHVADVSVIPLTADATVTLELSTSSKTPFTAKGSLTWDPTSGTFSFSGTAGGTVSVESFSLSAAKVSFVFTATKDTLSWSGSVSGNIVDGNGFAQTVNIVYKTGVSPVITLGVAFEEFIFGFSGSLKYNPICGSGSVGTTTLTLKPPSVTSPSNSYYTVPSTSNYPVYDILVAKSDNTTYDRCLQTLKLAYTHPLKWSINKLPMTISSLEVTGCYAPLFVPPAVTFFHFKWPVIPGRHFWNLKIAGSVTAPWGVVPGTVSLTTAINDYPQLSIPYVFQKGGWNISLDVIYGSNGGHGTGFASVDCIDSTSTLHFAVVGQYDTNSKQWTLTGTSNHEDLLLKITDVFLTGSINATFTSTGDSWAGHFIGFDWNNKISHIPILVAKTKRSIESDWDLPRGEPIVLSINPLPQRIRSEVPKKQESFVSKRDTQTAFNFEKDGISFSASIPTIECSNDTTSANFTGQVSASLDGLPGQHSPLNIDGVAEFSDCDAGWGGDFTITFIPTSTFVLSVGDLDIPLALFHIVVAKQGTKFSAAIQATFGDFQASLTLSYDSYKEMIQVGDSGVISVVEDGSVRKNPKVAIIFLLSTDRTFALSDLIVAILPNQGNVFPASAVDAVVKPLSKVSVTNPYVEINVLEKYIHVGTQVNIFGVHAEFNAMFKLDNGTVVVVSVGLPSIASVPGLGFIAKAGIDADFRLTLASADVARTPWEGAVGAGLTLAFDLSMDFKIAGATLSQLLHKTNIPLPPNATITFYGNIASMSKMSFEVFLASKIGFSFLYLDRVGFSVFLDGNQAGIGLLVHGGFQISNRAPVGVQHCLVNTVVAIQGPPLNLAFDVDATLDTIPNTLVVFPGFQIAFPVGFTAHIDITTGTPIPSALGFEGGLVLGFPPNEIKGYVKVNLPIEQPQNIFLGLSISGLTLNNFLDLIFNSPLWCPGGVNGYAKPNSNKRAEMGFCAVYQTPHDPWMDLFGLEKLGFCLNAGPNAITWGGSCTGDLSFSGTEVVDKLSAQGSITNLKFGVLQIPYAMFKVGLMFGIQVEGTMKPISLGVLSITSATDKTKGPSVYLSLTKEISKIGFSLNGMIKTPIFTVASYVNISKAGMFMTTSVNICELIGVGLSITAPTPHSLSSLSWTVSFFMSMGTAQLGQLVNDVLNFIIQDATKVASAALGVAKSAANDASAAATSAANALAGASTKITNAQNSLAAKQAECNDYNRQYQSAKNSYDSCGRFSLGCKAKYEVLKLAAEGKQKICNAALSVAQGVLGVVNSGISVLESAANKAKSDFNQAASKLASAQSTLSNIPTIHSTALSDLINVYELSSTFQLSSTMGKITLLLKYSLLGGSVTTDKLEVDITASAIKNWFISLFHPSLFKKWVGSLKRAEIDDTPELMFDGKLSDLCTTFTPALPMVLSDGSSSKFMNQNLPSCLLNSELGGSTGPVTTISLRDGVLAGPLPDLSGQPNQALHLLSLHGNNITGQIPNSWASLSGIQYLDLSLNHGLTGDLSILQSLSSLTYLDVHDNMMTYKDHPYKLLSSFPKLEFFDLGFVNITERFPALGPLVKHQKPISIQLAFVYAQPVSTFCESCSASILEGNCAASTCANSSVITATVASIISVVDSSLSFKINRVIGWDTASTLFSVTISSANQQYNYLDATKRFNSLNTTKGVSYAYAIPGCLPGLSGDLCQFFCPTSWEAFSHLPYVGGMISRSSVIALPIDILKSMVPSCLVPTGCGSLVDGEPCAVALQTVHNECADFLNGGAKSDVCKIAITKANDICPVSQCSEAVSKTYILAVNPGLADWEIAAVTLGAVGVALLIVVVAFLLTRSNKEIERA